MDLYLHVCALCMQVYICVCIHVQMLIDKIPYVLPT